MEPNLPERLQALSTLQHIPPDELNWLAEHGEMERHQPGLIFQKGRQIDRLWIILEGHISVRIDRGTGPKVVNTELNAGSVTGKLPYSRLVELPGDTFADEYTENLAIYEVDFPEMIHKCPLFTAYTVHSMIDRTRIHSTSAMQDERMISMGRMAAGLAHELNNPASVAIRDAKLLRESQSNADHALRSLSRAGLKNEQFNEIEDVRTRCMELLNNTSLSPLQKSDLQDNIANWLEKNQTDTIYADQLAELAVTLPDLDKLYKVLSSEIFALALQWIIASCSTHKLAMEIEQSTKQIHKLIEAVKKFTYMDNLSAKELVDVETSICDSLRLLNSKSNEKNAEIILEIDKALPGAYANGPALNQVWFSLLDNALDAIPPSGKIHVCAGLQSNHIKVRIIDNGPGIPANKLDRIFDPFYTTKPPGQGTGLGLDLSRRLIRTYSGDIYVRSQPGKTEFCVDLKTNNK